MDILADGVINYDNIRGKVEATEKEIESFGVNSGDLLFQRSSETLEDVGRANVYMDNRTAVYGGFVIRGRKIGSYDPFFVKYLLATPLARKRTCRMGAGAQHFNIGQESLAKISLYFPSMEEQQKIAEFLSLLDERIATQNKIIKDLKKLKSAISNTLINHRDKIVKIGSICSIAEQIKADMSKCDKIITVRLHCKGVCRSSANNLELGATQYYVRQKGQLIWGKQNFHHGAIGIVPDNLDGGLTSKDIPSFDIDSNYCCPKFILYQLQMPCYYEATEAYMTGTGSKRLKEETFLNMKISLPPLSEQREIAKAIETIEAKLNVEMALLDTYKLQKTYLLNQMFI